MKTKNIIFTLVFIILVVIVGVLIWHAGTPASTNNPSGTTGTSTSDTDTNQTTTFDQTTSDGTITFGYSSADFGLATNPQQILVTSYIPPCDPAFNYCLYYTGDAYKGTNFESAGLRIEKRTDLKTEQVCLNTPPDGFSKSTVPTDSKSADTYASSVFTNVGDAGAGHVATGSDYRLFVKASSTCYELETRVGETQFQNYPAGTIKEFTDTDVSDMHAQLMEIVDQVSLAGEKSLFP